MSADKVNHFQRPSMRSIVCPKCGHRFPPDEVKADQRIEQPSHGPRCIECKQPIAAEPLSFGGGFACEPCVVAYYRPHGAEIAAREVRERKIDAARVLRQRGRV